MPIIHLHLQEVLRTMDSSVAMKTSNIQIVGIIHHLSLKEPKFLGKMIDYRSVAQNVQFEPGAFCWLESKEAITEQ